MTDYAAMIRGLTPSQRAALDAIAIDEFPSSRRSAAALARKGLVTVKERAIGEGLPGVPLIVTEYSMPWAVHMAWCGVCSDEIEEGDRA